LEPTKSHGSTPSNSSKLGCRYGQKINFVYILEPFGGKSTYSIMLHSWRQSCTIKRRSLRVSHIGGRFCPNSATLRPSMTNLEGSFSFHSCWAIDGAPHHTRGASDPIRCFYNIEACMVCRHVYVKFTQSTFCTLIFSCSSLELGRHPRQ